MKLHYHIVWSGHPATGGRFISLAAYKQQKIAEEAARRMALKLDEVEDWNIMPIPDDDCKVCNDG